MAAGGMYDVAAPSPTVPQQATSCQAAAIAQQVAIAEPTSSYLGQGSPSSQGARSSVWGGGLSALKYHANSPWKKK